MHQDNLNKYPQLKNELEAALALQAEATSLIGRERYQRLQRELNALIPKVIELARLWNEPELRYTITKMELVREEVIKIEENSRAYDALLEQLQSGGAETISEEEE